MNKLIFYLFPGQDLESRSSQPRETPVRNIEELRTTLLQNLDEKKRISVPDSDEKISVPGQNFEVDKNTSLNKLEAQRNANIHRESIPPAEIQKTDKNVKKLRKESILKHHFLMDKFQNSRKEVREVRETGEVKEVMEVSEVMKVMEVRSSDESDSSSESWKKINSLRYSLLITFIITHSSFYSYSFIVLELLIHRFIITHSSFYSYSFILL